MTVLQSASSNNALITQELAETLRKVLGKAAKQDISVDEAWNVLERYDNMFSTKPNVNCRCVEHAEKHDSGGNEESVPEA